MPAVSGFPPGLHARPLLGWPRAALRAYAEAQRLDWIEDPSNRDARHLRNHLREAVMPRLRERWPQAPALLARSAALSAGAAALLDALALEDLARCAGEERGSLQIPALLALDELRRDNLLRVWIGALGLPLPEQQHIARLSKEVLAARADRSPLLRWPGAELRRYRERLYAMPPLPPPPPRWEAALKTDAAIPLPAGCGSLEGRLAKEAALRAPRRGESVKVRLAAEGERIQLPDRAHRHALKDLCQQAGIPPWVRRRLPVVLFDDRVAAVADRWIAAEFARGAGSAGLRLRWRDPPAGYPA
jgi:tRNA(Ile)-lysidine synthase